jgi:hypothetical protein
MRELIIVANTKNVRAKFSYCNFERNKKKITIKQICLLLDLII